MKKNFKNGGRAKGGEEESVCWALLRSTSEIVAVQPRAPEVAVASAQWHGVTLCSFCPHFHYSQARAFPVVGPSVWNGLPRVLSDTFYSRLKTVLFNRARDGSASE